MLTIFIDIDKYQQVYPFEKLVWLVRLLLILKRYLI